MLTCRKLNELSKKLSEILECKINILNINEVENKDNYIKSDDKICNTIIEEYPYVICIEQSNNLTKKEIELISFLLQEGFEDEKYLTSKVKIKEVLSLFEGDLGKKEVDNILKKLGFSLEHEIAVAIVKFYEGITKEEITEILKNYTWAKFVDVMIDDNLMAIIYQTNNLEEINLAKFIVDTVETELFGRIKVGVSTLKNSWDIKEAYQESLEALNIGIRYELPGSVYLNKDLLLYQILSNINNDVMEKLYKKVVKIGLDKLNHEELKTANVFINNNLNISEAARKLFIHRNTLIYRLDKIQKDTGYDLRLSKDAFDFKLLLILYQHMGRK